MWSNHKDRLMNREEIKKALERLREFRDSLLPILETLRRYKWDLEKERESDFQFSGILDFSDLYRYLHPLLDFTAYRNPERFYSEQIAFHYLMTKDHLSLYLLSEYIEEYRLSLRSSQVQLAEFAILPEEDVKRRIVRMDKKLASILNELGQSTESEKVQSLSRIYQSNRDLLDILFDNARTKILQKGSSIYNDLLEKHLIQHASSIPGITPEDLEFHSTSRYDRIYSHLENIRPGRHRANQIDARAFHIVQNLNRKYFRQKMVFLFFTSSPRIAQAFDNEIAIELHGDRELFEDMENTSVIRTPQYVIFRFLFSTCSCLKSSLDIERFYNLITRYLDITNKLDDYFDRALSQSDIDSQAFMNNLSEAVNVKNQLEPQIELITEFGSSPYLDSSLYGSISSRLGLKSLLQDNTISERDINEKISGVLSNPSKLVGHFEANARKLSTAIGKLEGQLLPIVYQKGVPGVVYDVHISETAVKEVKLAARKIVSLLAKQTPEDFAKAFIHLSQLRSDHPTLPDTFILSSKVYRAMQAYTEALEHARRAITRAPSYSEALIEMGFCYRYLAHKEKNPNLLMRAWDYFKRAAEIQEDARVYRELAFIVWLSMEEKYDISNQLKLPDPERYLVENSGKALELSKSKTGDESRLSITIMNDKSYYLALRGYKNDMEEALGLINTALKLAPNLSKKTIASFKDTKGFVLLKQVEISQPKPVEERKLLREAASLIREAYSENPESLATQKHLFQCMNIVLDRGYFWAD